MATARRKERLQSRWVAAVAREAQVVTDPGKLEIVLLGA